MATQATTTWQIKGTIVLACNCDYGCPCNFNALPTQGHCEGGWSWHIEEGSYGNVRLDNLTFSILCDWPGAIHEGNGKALVLIDEHADNAQYKAISTIVSGEVGGPWEILRHTWTEVYGHTPLPTSSTCESTIPRSVRAAFWTWSSRLLGTRSQGRRRIRASCCRKASSGKMGTLPPPESSGYRIAYPTITRASTLRSLSSSTPGHPHS